MRRAFRLTSEIETHDAASVLRAAKDRIADPAHFAQYACARAADGGSTLPWDSDAVAYDIYGAIVAVAYEVLPNTVHSPQFQHAAHLMRQAAVVVGRAAWRNVNDGIGHEAVMATLDQAIRWAEGEAGAPRFVDMQTRQPGDSTRETSRER